MNVHYKKYRKAFLMYHHIQHLNIQLLCMGTSLEISDELFSNRIFPVSGLAPVFGPEMFPFVFPALWGLALKSTQIVGFMQTPLPPTRESCSHTLTWSLPTVGAVCTVFSSRPILTWFNKQLTRHTLTWFNKQFTMVFNLDHNYWIRCVYTLPPQCSFLREMSCYIICC